MTVHLLDGTFPVGDGKKLISSLFELKIKFHEGKISADSSEEEIKMREGKIKSLQDELVKVKKYMEYRQGVITLKSDVMIE